MSTHRQSTFNIWRWPMLLASLSMFGLLSALLGQGGIWWTLSWIALGIPLAVIVIFSTKARSILHQWAGKA